jgi:Ran GTPase-activating protein (RanGAP) involved in mRNA processing and transport
VKGLPSLEELHLDDNDIESEGAAQIAQALKAATSPSLRLLSMCTCSISAYGALKVAK